MVPAFAAAVAAAVVVAGLVWLTTPALAHTANSVIPQPAHGVALALLIATRRELRVRMGILLFAGVSVGALIAGGGTMRVLTGAAMVVVQASLIIALFQRISREMPLMSVSALTRFLAAVIVGTLPVAVLASLIASAVAPEHTWYAWWSVASTSGIIFAPALLSLMRSSDCQPGSRPLLGPEFLLLLGGFLFVLLDVFLRLGFGFDRIPHAITTLPFLVWAGLRFGLRGASITSLVLVVVSFAATVSGTGAYMGFGPDLIDRVRIAGYFMAAVIASVMLFAVAVAEGATQARRTDAAFAQLRAILEGAGDLIAAVDRDLMIVAVNPSWVAGFERASGFRARAGISMQQALASVPHDADVSLANWRRALAGERFVSVREFGSPDRHRQEYEITYAPVRDEAGEIVGASQIVRNVSDRLQREAEEAEARRLESIGRLAGGVAHDFNNLMTAVMGYTELVASSLSADDPRRGDLAQVERAAARAGELTQQLLAFARRRLVEPRVVDAGELVEGFSRLLAPLLGPNVSLVVHSAPGLRRVRIDPTQFEQVVMNLAVNARDAMSGSGRLLIETANDERDGVQGVRLSVRDSGTGMTPEVLERIFEPFYTTKPVGEGTGLGLATVHGIVHQAGGDIDVESVPGLGTSFHIFFPAAPTPEPAPVVDAPRSLARHRP